MVFTEPTTVITVKVPFSELRNLQQVMEDYRLTMAEAIRRSLHRGNEALLNDVIIGMLSEFTKGSRLTNGPISRSFFCKACRLHFSILSIKTDLPTIVRCPLCQSSSEEVEKGAKGGE